MKNGYIPKELADEYNGLTKEWFEIIEFAQVALDDLNEGEIDKVIDTVEWLVDHCERVRDFDDKLDMMYNSDNINWS